MLAGGYLMVACQLLTTAALWSSTTFPSCETSNQCERGRWCSVGVQASGGRCQPCGDDLPLPKQTDSARGYTYNKPAPSEADFAGYNLTLVMQTCAEPTQATVGIFGVGEVTLFSPEAVTSWCAACTNSATHFVDPMTHVMELEANAAVMGWVDWVALVLASYIVGITVAGEIKDIHLCSIATEKAVDCISLPYQRALTGLNSLRRWVFLTLFGWIVPSLVGLKGGDALNICFNTIAILFLADVDNISYQLGLSEDLRGRMERDGHMLLKPAEKIAMARTKKANVCAVMLCVLVSVGLFAFTPCPASYNGADGRFYGGCQKVPCPAEIQAARSGCGFGGLIGTFFYLFNAGWIAALAESVALRELATRNTPIKMAKGVAGSMVAFCIWQMSVF
eukprot:COSAG01_NODE_659_length_14436_cov_15.108112_3_plen_393_part_00